MPPSSAGDSSSSQHSRIAFVSALGAKHIIWFP
jgi:hypothetical protein